MTRPKPIIDPHAGTSYQVVVSFRVQTTEDKNGDPDLIEAFVRNRLGRMKDLTVHIRKIGAGGETREDDGRFDAPSVLANTDDVEAEQPTSGIKPSGGLL